MNDGESSMTITKSIRSLVTAAIAGLTLAATPVLAQGMETIDPDTAIDADLASPSQAQPTDTVYTTVPPADAPPLPAVPAETPSTAPVAPEWSDPQTETAEVAAADDTTYGEDDLIGAAEGVFGKGAKGVAKMIENLLAKQGKPNAYIVGREAGGAIAVGVRYGSGTLHHKVEGERPVYWTGPSIGFDLGANAAQTFVLVYNLYDTEELYERYPSGEGDAYVVGGLTASYLRKGDVVMIPIRMGAGLRLGINAGYMKFSKKQRWLPF